MQDKKHRKNKKLWNEILGSKVLKWIRNASFLVLVFYFGFVFAGDCECKEYEPQIIERDKIILVNHTVVIEKCEQNENKKDIELWLKLHKSNICKTAQDCALGWYCDYNKEVDEKVCKKGY